MMRLWHLRFSIAVFKRPPSWPTVTSWLDVFIQNQSAKKQNGSSRQNANPSCSKVTHKRRSDSFANHTLRIIILPCLCFGPKILAQGHKCQRVIETWHKTAAEVYNHQQLLGLHPRPPDQQLDLPECLVSTFFFFVILNVILFPN